LSTERDNALFRALVEGEIDESSPEIRTMVEQDPQLAKEWKETQALLSALDASGQERREVLERSSNIADPAGAERAEQALRAAMADAAPKVGDRPKLGDRAQPRNTPMLEHAAQVPSAGGSREKRASSPLTPSRWKWIAAAAALVALLFLLQPWKRAEDIGHGDVMLGGAALEPRTTIDPATETPCFEWKGKVSAAAKFTVTVEGFVADSNTWRPLPEQTGIVETRWCPPKDVVASWPSRIRWRVAAVDPNVTGELRSPWSEVSLRR
jgi:hypothetical protein